MVVWPLLDLLLEAIQSPVVVMFWVFMPWGGFVRPMSIPTAHSRKRPTPSGMGLFASPSIPLRECYGDSDQHQYGCGDEGSD